MVNKTPVRSRRMSERTSEEGVIVGKGPAVSVAPTVQDPLPVVVVVVVVVVLLPLSFLQASRIRGTVLAPIKNFFRKCFRDCSMMVVFGFVIRMRCSSVAVETTTIQKLKKSWIENPKSGEAGKCCGIQRYLLKRFKNCSS